MTDCNWGCLIAYDLKFSHGFDLDFHPALAFKYIHILSTLPFFQQWTVINTDHLFMVLNAISCPHWLLDFNLLSQCTAISGYPCHSLKHISRRNFGRLSCLLRTGVLSWLVGVFFSVGFLLSTLWNWALCVWMYNLGQSEYVNLFIPVFIHTCTDINFNQGKLRWNTNKRGVVRHDISFMDIAEKINVWASSLSVTTFSYWGRKRHIWQLIPHWLWEILTAILFYRPWFIYTIV